MAFWGVLFLLLLRSTLHGNSQKLSDDQAAMEAILKAITPNPPENWTSGSDCCTWGAVSCDRARVTAIMIKEQNLTGTLHADINKLTSLQRLHIMRNRLAGDFPSLQGLSNLKELFANGNGFTSFPGDDFFAGLDSLQEFHIDYNPLTPWRIPVKLPSKLTSFTASGANVTGTIPDVFDTMPSLVTLELAFNNLEGGLPGSFSGSGIATLKLNNIGLNGTISALQNMTGLGKVWLHGNGFAGALPDFSQLTNLYELSLEGNKLTGIVPASLQGLASLKTIDLSSNSLQGPMPKFTGALITPKSVILNSNQFCKNDSSECDPRVTTLLSIAKGMGYPLAFAENWAGNDPCSHWNGVTCSAKGDIVVLNFPNMGLTGKISSNFSMLPSLSKLILSNNNLTGTIPQELTSLQRLEMLDLSNNDLYGKVPSFPANVVVKLDGNKDIGKDRASDTTGAAGGSSKSKSTVVIGVVIGSVVGVVLLVLLGVFLLERKQRGSEKRQSPNALVIHPSHSGDQNGVKITIANRVNGVGSQNHSNGSNGIQVEAGNMIISIQVLRTVTNNFNEEKILGKGGFGTVYEGELYDGTKIAVKRMQSGIVADKGLHEFKSEIAVLTKVRHRHLVGLLGYCLDDNEKLLVYEHMPQGTLSRHLFNWKEEGLKPLDWTRRLTIALDVARGVQYLHSLANEIFIHRDLKPSNILLGDDMRAKVADFGLVRLAPAGKASIETRLAGTFGYLAPEYAATGRMTLKVDVYSFGVILMELLTGRKAIDDSQPGESYHLVTWFRRKLIKPDALPDVVDQTIDVNEETIPSIFTVAELAGHCSARQPEQRPDIGHAVNVLASLVEQWKPSTQEDIDEMDAINLDVPLNEAVKMWQANEGKSYMDGYSSLTSAVFPSGDDTTQNSIPNRPSGFAASFSSSDGR